MRAERLYAHHLRSLDETEGSSHPATLHAMTNLGNTIKTITLIPRSFNHISPPLHHIFMPHSIFYMYSSIPVLICYCTHHITTAELYVQYGHYQEAEPLFLHCLSVLETPTSSSSSSSAPFSSSSSSALASSSSSSFAAVMTALADVNGNSSSSSPSSLAASLVVLGNSHLHCRQQSNEYLG